MEPSAPSLRTLLVGLPETGKTTFLAALFHVAESNEVAPKLRLGSYTESFEYLTMIRDRWIQAEKVERNRVEHVAPVTLPLVDTETDQPLTLNVPDMSGEEFRSQWEERVWTKEFHRSAREADSVVLFVHPDRLNETKGIGEADFVLGPESGDEPTDEAAPSEPSAVVRPWEHRDASAQVATVDIVQFLMSAAPGGQPLRLVLVVSAWDIVESVPEPSLSPDDWVRRKLPLLWQFLTSNPERVDWTVFGVSAQGGSVEDQDGDSKKRLQEVPDPSERVVVVGADGVRDHDVTRPVRWLARSVGPPRS